MIVRCFFLLLAAVTLVRAQSSLPSGAVINSASLSPGPLAPGTLAIATGQGISETTASAPGDGAQQLPTKLGGVQVLFYGTALPLLSVSPEQVQFQLPYSLGGLTSAAIYIRTERPDGHTTLSQPREIAIEPTAPGIYAFGGAEPREGLILHAQTSPGAQAGAPVTSASPARPGETLIIWATGLGNVETADASVPKAGVPLAGPDAPVTNDVEAVVDGRSVPVVSAVLPQGAIGVYEVRIQIPDDLPSDSKAQLTIVQNGRPSNSVLFPMQSAGH